MTREFRYLRDPVFLGALALFALNQLLLKRVVSSPFLHHHFNDLLLIPCALPPLLRLHASLRIRPAQAVPTAPEIAGHLVIWSLLFEFAGPALATHATGDFRDIACYWLGGCLSFFLWRASYRPAFSKRLANA